MKTILVTGGGGYIGSHTVVELLNSGYEVVVFDNFDNSNPNILNKIHQITGKYVKVYHKDVREPMDDILEHQKIDGVIHFAAHKSVSESVEEPIKYYDNNITSLLNVLHHCEIYKIKNFIFSSSCSIYGNVSSLPVNEDTPISEPESPYANTKLIGERIIKDFTNVKDLNAISLRYFNPVGAHESGLIGESPINKPNNLVPVICNSVVNNEEMLIFGNNYPTRDGTAIRDYVHVVDIAKAHVKAIDYLFNNKNTSKNEVFNLGTGNGITVLEMIKAFEKENNLNIKYKIVERRPGDIDQIYSDSTKAENLLGWKAELGVNDMMKSAWNWQKNYNI